MRISDWSSDVCSSDLDEAELPRPFEIAAVGHLEIARVLRNLLAPEAVIFDVALQLVRIRRALAVRFANLAAPAGEQADAGRAFVADDVVGVVAVLRPIGRAHV